MGRGRITLGLYNTYDRGRFLEAHRRALARSGPVALAFDCNLATFGFPYGRELTTPREVCDWISTTTSIGEGGGYLRELAGAGRFSTFPFPRAGLPPQLGDPVVTTRRPEAGKGISPLALARRVAAGRSHLLLFGLGPRGLPRELFDLALHHLDITGRGLSLETCTALGGIPGVLWALLGAAGPPLGPTPG